jgi:sulfate adenylyltransferase subunit 1
MDLVVFDEAVFNKIKADVEEIAKKMGYEGDLDFVPIAAKYGDNVVQSSTKMNWYSGPTLLEYLEELPVHKKEDALPARLPVQFVIRPHSDQHHDFRGYAGKLSSGQLHVGQEVLVLPSSRKSKITKIYHAQKEVDSARSEESITVELQDDVDISRGNMIVPADAAPTQTNAFVATISWMDEQALTTSKSFLLQHGVNVVKAKITGLQSKLDIHTMEETSDVSQFKLNDIGRVGIKTAKPIFADLYKDNPRNGAFILIDEFSNNTVAVGFMDKF